MFWIRADRGADHDSRKKMVTSALENDILTMIIRKEDKDTLSKLGKFATITMEDGVFTFQGQKGSVISINSSGDVDRAIDAAKEIDILVVSTENWKVIPLENLIAAFQSVKARLFASVQDEKEARLFIDTLEKGVDGIVLDSQDPGKINTIKRILEEKDNKTMELVNGRIDIIKPLGMGDRVCIDTCSILGDGEGLLIGSSSGAMFLVHSESVSSEYAEPRPFRVNAGPVHSYILMPEGRTKYLSELLVGDEVLVVDMEGNTRISVIGRLKIERRPLMMVKAVVNGSERNIILQNAETIRLVSGGQPVSLVDLKKGDEVLMRVDDGGRHFGMKIHETMIEK